MTKLSKSIPTSKVSIKDTFKLTTDEFGAVFYGDKMVACPNAHIYKTVSDKPSETLTDIFGYEHLLEKAKTKWFMGYEGTMVRVWKHPETGERMISTNRIPDARTNKYGRSKPFGEIANNVLPIDDFLFHDERSMRQTHHFVLVDKTLLISSKALVYNPFAVYLYTTEFDNETQSPKVLGQVFDFPMPKGIIPRSTDFKKMTNSTLSRKELTLKQVHNVLKYGINSQSYSRCPMNFGEFVFAESFIDGETRHFRVDSPGYVERRRIMGNDHITFRRYLSLIESIHESIENKEYLPHHYGYPVGNDWVVQLSKFGYGRDIVKKKWKKMTDKEIEKTVLHMFIMSAPKYLQKEISGYFDRLHK